MSPEYDRFYDLRPTEHGDILLTLFVTLDHDQQRVIRHILRQHGLKNIVRSFARNEWRASNPPQLTRDQWARLHEDLMEFFGLGHP